MPTEDKSQTTRAKMLSGRELAKFNILNPYSYQGGRYNFTQSELLTKTLGYALSDICNCNNNTSSSPEINSSPQLMGSPGITVPDPPTSVSATPGNTEATIYFTAPINDGGSTITSYTVESSPGGFSATGPTSPIIVSGLTNGISYTFTVVATNAAGNSIPSSASSAIIPSGDLIVSTLTTSLSDYQAAANDDWVKITSTEYANLQTNISGTSKVGISDTYLAYSSGAGLANSNSALVANSLTAASPAIPANNYLYAFAVRWGSSLPAVNMGVYTNTNSSSTGGFSQVGSFLPQTTSSGLSYYVRKGVSTTNGSTSGLLACFTGTKMDYPNPSFTGSAGYIGFTVLQGTGITPIPVMRYLLGNGTAPGANSTLSGGLSNYGAFNIQGLTTATKQWV